MNAKTRWRILYTTADASPQSGAWKSLLDMSRSIAGSGVQSVFVLHDDARTSSLLSDDERAATYFLPLPRARKYSSLFGYVGYLRDCVRSIVGLRNVIRRQRPDAVHANEIFDWYAAVAGWWTGVPVVWHVRADYSDSRRVRAVLQWLLRRFATTIVPVSESVRERMCGTPELLARSFVLYDTGPDYQRYAPGRADKDVRAELGIAADAPLLVMIGKLSIRKGHATAIRAIKHVIEQQPNAHLVIVGGDIDGRHHREYAERLRALPAELGVEKHVTFAGFRGDVPQLIASATIVLHTATYPDPFPGVVLQGMAVGKPVIASDLGGPREQIENGETGILVRPGDAVILSDAILDLLADPVRMQQMGTAAAEAVRLKYNQQRFQRELSEIYQFTLAIKPVRNRERNAIGV